MADEQPRRRRILVVDDEASVCWAVERLLRSRGYEVAIADGAVAAMRVLRRQQVDLVLSDLRMPGGSGLDLLEEIRASRPELPVVLATAYGTVDVAAEALARGAVDVLSKPIDMDRALAVVERILGRRGIAIEAESGRAIAPLLVGGSLIMRETFRRIALAAAGDLPVLVRGPTGSGKELAAHLMHRHGRRPGGPFVVADCGAIAAAGADRGSAELQRRLEEARGGSLMLDEVATLPSLLQGALLRVLDDMRERPQPDAARIIALSNRELGSEEHFRADLLHRLAGFVLRMPALAEHAEDVPAIAGHLLARLAARTGKGISLTEQALAALRTHAWPGNVRELRQVLEEAALLAGGGIIDREHLRLPEAETPAERPAGQRDEIEALLRDHPGDAHRLWIERCELPLLAAALERTAGNQLRAAEMLGVHRTTLRRRAQELGLAVGRNEDEPAASTG
ncbi:MAG: sigma-54-dependent Fis family transcriptional regulator [Planctomycetes bacterium]|nr:sigma-54-dependent Fis family transcriptional regulator [Planctomycetota bacterium]